METVHFHLCEEEKKLLLFFFFNELQIGFVDDHIIYYCKKPLVEMHDIQFSIPIRKFVNHLFNNISVFFLMIMIIIINLMIMS